MTTRPVFPVQLGWRRPLRRQWLYLDVVPGLDFEREDNWDEVVWLRVGLEVFFDDSAQNQILNDPFPDVPAE